MPAEYRDQRAAAQERDGIAGRARIVADYIAGMTDRYAIVEHARLFDPAQRT
jgi:dGTPase